MNRWNFVRSRGRHALETCALILLASSLAACVQLSFVRETRLEPVPPEALSTLVAGTSDLDAALTVLGPPVLAWELPDQGTALAWGWYHSKGWRLRVSDANRSGVSLSFNYESAVARMRGAVLFFDHDWRLTSVRQGVLSDLRDSTRARPTEVESE